MNLNRGIGIYVGQTAARKKLWDHNQGWDFELLKETNSLPSTDPSPIVVSFTPPTPPDNLFTTSRSFAIAATVTDTHDPWDVFSVHVEWDMDNGSVVANTTVYDPETILGEDFFWCPIIVERDPERGRHQEEGDTKWRHQFRREEPFINLISAMSHTKVTGPLMQMAMTRAETAGT